jgi:CheY-like chemotaxis protein
MKVLVVDDDEGILQLIGWILRGSGIRLLFTTDAREALAAIEVHEIDLLISDVMPVMNGPALAAAARRLRPRIFQCSTCQAPNVQTDFRFWPSRFRYRNCWMRCAALLNGRRQRPPNRRQIDVML